MRYFAIGDDVLIQAVSGTKTSRSVVSGRDPTVINAGSRTGEILYIYFNKLPRPIRADGQNPAVLRIDLKIDKLPTVREAETMTERLQARLGHEDVRVAMRTDTWFQDDPGAPLWYPFSADQRHQPMPITEPEERCSVLSIRRVSIADKCKLRNDEQIGVGERAAGRLQVDP